MTGLDRGRLPGEQAGFSGQLERTGPFVGQVQLRRTGVDSVTANHRQGGLSKGIGNLFRCAFRVVMVGNIQYRDPGKVILTFNLQHLLIQLLTNLEAFLLITLRLK